MSGILGKPNDGKGYNKKKREEGRKRTLFSPTLSSIIREIIDADPEIGNVYFNGIKVGIGNVYFN
ncbi:hypothetical protein [Ornithinibacillus sp. JPR2-1]|uniref:hypothetical protein n=1 Tax=Ornithinibacillus sp. JPR2-1 TaxID=2094019 RepID=UPI0031D11358